MARISDEESALSSPSLRTLLPKKLDCPSLCHQQYSNKLQGHHLHSRNVQQGHDEYAAKGKRLLLLMESFETMFSLKLAYLVFAAAEQLSTNLQAKDTMVAGGSREASLLIAQYTSLRTEAAFTTFYQGVVDSTTGLTDEPALPRYRKAPKKFDGGAQQHQYSSAEDRYRHIYFEVLDHPVGEIKRRFNQSDITLEKLLLDSANGKEVPEMSKAIRVFSWKIQLVMLPDAIKAAGAFVKVEHVTNFRTICQCAQPEYGGEEHAQ